MADIPERSFIVRGLDPEAAPPMIGISPRIAALHGRSSETMWKALADEAIPQQGSWGYLAYDIVRSVAEFQKGCSNTQFPEMCAPWECEECAEAFVSYVRKTLAETNPKQSLRPPPSGGRDVPESAEKLGKG